MPKRKREPKISTHKNNKLTKISTEQLPHSSDELLDEFLDHFSNLDLTEQADIGLDLLMRQISGWSINPISSDETNFKRNTPSSKGIEKSPLTQGWEELMISYCLKTVTEDILEYSIKASAVNDTIKKFKQLNVEIYGPRVESAENHISMQELSLIEIPYEIMTSWKIANVFSSITSLALNDNRLSALPNEIGLLKDIENIELGNNEFSKFPEVLFSLPKLLTLSLAGNKITEIPEEIDKMSSLEWLNLAKK